MTDRIFVRSGHGYETGSYGRCDAFDGFTVIAAPLPGFDDRGRNSRVFGRVSYGSHTVALAEDSLGDLFLLVHHGGGRRVYRIPPFYGDADADVREHIRVMPERLQYALLYTLYSIADRAYKQGQEEIGRKWAQAYVDKRIKMRRATKTRVARVEIVND